MRSNHARSHPSFRVVGSAVLWVRVSRPVALSSAGPDGKDLITVPGAEVHFGTTLYPYRKDNDVNWLLENARSLGLTELRVGYPREQLERAANPNVWNPENYRDARPEVMDALRKSGFEILMTLLGPGRDAQGHIRDWPRNADGTIDGKAAAPGYANYVRWVAGHTKDFVTAYELWNEAFNTISVRGVGTGKGFGPGGSLQNADNYSAMMAPALEVLRRQAPGAKITIEGNYWNLPRSVDKSTAYQSLLKRADYAIIHPYGFKPAGYQPGGHIFDSWTDYHNYNTKIRFWWSEYGVHPKDVKIDETNWTDFGQAKAVLRATALHLHEGIQHLDVFDLYYPSQPAFSLLDAKTRKPRQAFGALRNLIGSLHPGQPGGSGELNRSGALPATLRDLAVSVPGGFTYLIWQNTDPSTFEQHVPVQKVSVSLSTPGAKVRLARAYDPLTGKSLGVKSQPGKNGLTLDLEVPDSPILCEMIRER
jgi:hypothetical protein